MKITGFKLLKNGIGGIEVEGIELAGTSNSHIMFRDSVKRTRKFPLTQTLRLAVQMLNYPFLVGAEYWRTEFARFMKDDYSAPERKGENLNESNFKKLITFWESSKVEKVSIEKGLYKIQGSVEFSMCVVKATVLIDPNDDHSLYSFVEETLSDIVKLIEQTITAPQAGLGTGEEIREIVSRISSSSDDEIPDDMSDEEAYLHMMKTAQKKGYGIVMNDNMLAMISEGIKHTEEEDEPETFKLDAGDEPDDEPAEVVSATTKDESIFKDEVPPIDEELA